MSTSTKQVGNLPIAIATALQSFTEVHNQTGHPIKLGARLKEDEPLSDKGTSKTIYGVRVEVSENGVWRTIILVNYALATSDLGKVDWRTPTYNRVLRDLIGGGVLLQVLSEPKNEEFINNYNKAKDNDTTADTDQAKGEE